MEGGWKDITAVVVVEEARLLRKEMGPAIRKGKGVLRHYVQIRYGGITKASKDLFIAKILIMAEEALHHCVRNSRTLGRHASIQSFNKFFILSSPISFLASQATLSPPGNFEET